MTVVNPPGFLQNAGATHTAELTRNATVTGHSLGRLAVGSLKPLGGVMRDLGSGLAVVENGTPNMSVNIGSGVCYIPGTEGTTQGVYSCVNNGTINVTLAASSPTNPRIDIIVFKVEDSAYSGAANTSSIVAVTGTPAASPAVPAAPNNSLILAQISVPANDTAITNSQITDRRRFLTAPGGVIHCTSTSRPDTATINVGQLIFETNTELFRVWDGINFALVPYTIQETTLGSNQASITFNNIPSEIKTLRIHWSARMSTATGFDSFMMTINNVTTTNYFGNFNSLINAGNNPVHVAGAVAGRVGALPGSTAGANLFACGVITIPNWNAAHNNLNWVYQSDFYDTPANSVMETGGGLYLGNGPYTRIDLRANTGNLVTGSQFTLEAVN